LRDAKREGALSSTDSPILLSSGRACGTSQRPRAECRGRFSGPGCKRRPREQPAQGESGPSWERGQCHHCPQVQEVWARDRRKPRPVRRQQTAGTGPKGAGAGRGGCWCSRGGRRGRQGQRPGAGGGGCWRSRAGRGEGRGRGQGPAVQALDVDAALLRAQDPVLGRGEGGQGVVSQVELEGAGAGGG